MVEELAYGRRNPSHAARDTLRLRRSRAAYRVRMDLIRMAASQRLRLTVAYAFHCPQPSQFASVDAVRSLL